MWLGGEPPDTRETADVGYMLTGFDWLTGKPFPETLPAWEVDRPAPEPLAVLGHEPVIARRPPGHIFEWGLTAILAVVVLAAAMVGGRAFGTVGGWLGGALGFVFAGALVWRLARWVISR